MHIGTARTALFNYLYAKHTGGRFLLRVEDTDRERSTEAAVQVIFDGLSWLGLPFDGEPVFQASRADRHRAVVLELLEAGKAYRCWLSGDELRRAANRPTSRVASRKWWFQIRKWNLYERLFYGPFTRLFGAASFFPLT